MSGSSPVQPAGASFPAMRMRRLRAAPWRRALVRENALAASDLVLPMFIAEDGPAAEEVSSMPGVSRIDIDAVVERAAEAASLGIPAVALFPNIDDALRSRGCEEAWNPDNLVCRATRRIKREVPEVGVMLDVALDPYNLDGQDGLVRDGVVLNDETVEALVRQSLAQVEAGADILAPSDMMDGRIGAIRGALEAAGHQDTLLLAYAAKYASALYAPFREAVGSARHLQVDKATYQMDPANTDEALREVALDIAEGADMVMVKPGLPYLDVCRRVKDTFGMPTLAYQVSGEYAMIQAAAERGWIDGPKVMMESLLAFRRAGCDAVVTYFAMEVARTLAERE